MNQLDKSWGLSAAIDLKSCSPEKIKNKEYIYQFSLQLCVFIEMKRFGEPSIVHFGEDPRVSGYTLVQLIETSAVTAHFANGSNAAYIDVFSCKYFEPQGAAEFCKEFFDAKSYELTVVQRK